MSSDTSPLAQRSSATSEDAVTRSAVPTTAVHRTARAAATWIASTVYTLVTLAVAFITTPILLKNLGEERLGAYRAASEWIGYLSLIDLGITPAIGVLVLRARMSGSISETAAVVRGGLKLLTLIGIITACLAVAIATSMPSLVPVSKPLEKEIVYSTLIGAGLLLLLPFQVSRMLLESEQRGYWINMALLCQALVAAILSVVLAKAGFGLVAQSGAILIGTSVGVICFLIPTWRWYVETPAAGAAAVNPRSIWQLGWPLALAGFGIRMNVMTDSLVVGYILGPTAVFHLFVTQRAVALFGGQINGVANASWAALAELRMTGRQDAFVAGIIELTGLIVGTGVALTGTVAAFNRHFVFLWVGPAHYAGDVLSCLTAVGCVVGGITTLYGWSLDSGGQTAARVHVSLIGAFVNLGLSIILTRWLGLPGVVLGTVIACTCSDAWFCPFLVCRRFGVPAGQIVRAIGIGCARGLPWAIFMAGVARLYTPPNWYWLIGEAVLFGFLSITYTWHVVLGPDDRRRWRKRLHNFPLWRERPV